MPMWRREFTLGIDGDAHRRVETCIRRFILNRMPRNRMARPCGAREPMRHCPGVRPVLPMKESAPSAQPHRRLPVGAEVQPDGGVHFRVWAPASKNAAVLLSEGEEFTDTRDHALTAEDGGYWSGLVSEAHTGMHYRFRIDSGDYPDPASRFQARGPHGPSRIVDPGTFAWTDGAWRGVTRHGQVI